MTSLFDWRDCITEQSLTPQSHDSPLLAFAPVYSSLGWRVFPIRPGGKDPLIANWQEQATTSLNKIAEWVKIWPDANVGIACGRGLLVGDFDGDKGATSLYRYVLKGRSFSSLPKTPIVRTKKGIHIYYEMPQGVSSRNYVGILPGVEFRTDGGYVIAPPSKHEDGDAQYLWIKDHGPSVPVAPAPSLFLLPKVQIKLLAEAVRKAAEAGEGRNSMGHWLACQLRDLQIPQVEAESLMERYCSIVNMASRNDHPYTIDEALNTTRSTYSTPARKPAGHQDDLQDIPYTDIGNAERLIERSGADLRFTNGGGWMMWTGSHWRDGEAYVQECAKQTARDIIKWALTLPNEEARKAALAWGLRSSDVKRVKGMITLAGSDPRVHRQDNQFDSDEWLLNLANGTLDLRTGLVRQHSREDCITKVVPISYDPDAKAPLWEAFLSRIMGGNESLIRFLQKAVGYTMTPSTGEQCLFFLYGTGRNGKTTFVEVVARLLGTYSFKINSELLMAGRLLNPEAPSPVIASMKGTRFVFASELEEGQRWAESKVKDLTGSDTLTGRHLNKEPTVFRPTHKLWIYGNHRPIVRGSTEGIWRRMRLVPFEVTIPEDEDDHDLATKLVAELPGILVWALRGCIEWQKEGLGSPVQVKAAITEYREDMDLVQQFIDEVCVRDEEARILFASLFRAYEAWCQMRGERAMTSTRFGESLTQKGFQGVKKSGSMFRLGITLIGGE